jgi:phage-related protein
MFRPRGSVRRLLWVSSCKRDYDRFPLQLQRNLGFELFLAQTGQHPPSAKLLRGFGSGIVELVADFDGDTYRAVYTVRFREAVYVLHAFMKKSKHGIKTPKSDIDLIRRRLKAAEADHARRTEEKKP